MYSHIEKVRTRLKRLYGQAADAVRIGKYVRRWWQWVRSGLDGYALELAVVKPSLCATAARKLPRKPRPLPAVPRPASRGRRARGLGR